MLICGIDEAGRGPLAGPVCAAAVILTKTFPLDLLNDSKKLSPLRRKEAHNVILTKAFACGIGWASHEEIDELNILKASLLAMKRAFEDMLKNVDLAACEIKAIVDGIYVPDINISCEAMVKADAKVAEVMAASIVAKHERDTYMEKMAELYPQYGYEKHKGYPTKAHREAIKLYGNSPIQRLTFRI